MHDGELEQEISSTPSLAILIKTCMYFKIETLLSMPNNYIVIIYELYATISGYDGFVYT